MKNRPRALVAVLHWGLGHATRCIPLINALLRAEVEVFIASDGDALYLLQKEFPELKSFELQSYKIRYDSKNMFWNILKQSKNIFKAIKKEQKQIENIVNQNNINLIFADNRFGCFSSSCKNIFITHQLFIQTGFLFTDWVAQRINHYFIRQFDEVWIPDVAKEPSLSGKLSHGRTENLPPCRYLGVLSRFELTNFEKDKKHSILIAVILSGPEPQRTIFEATILEQIAYLPYQFVFFRGSRMGRSIAYSNTEKIRAIFDIATREDMTKWLTEADVVISRSGYTTIMDLAYLGKKALLIPTPGQTEQEYLAAMLAKKNIFVTQSQHKINLQIGIQQALSETSGLADFQNDLDNNIKKVV
jgi:uncharacterized protein (TIGR00661 family)